jgi:hypothetical protein
MKAQTKLSLFSRRYRRVEIIKIPEMNMATIYGNVRLPPGVALFP